MNPILIQYNLFLVDLKINERSETVRVFIDKIPAVTIEDCVAVSRALEKSLNEQTDFSEHYALEVSSPGADQPFRVPEQYQQYQNRPVEVITYSGVKYVGILKSMNKEKIIIETEVRNKKKAPLAEVLLNLSEIKSTKPFLKY